MPSIHQLNIPPHPFWEFVAGIEDHPFFGAYGRPSQPPTADEANKTAQQGASAQANAQANESSKSKQPTAEDPPEVDPATVKPTSEEGARQFPFRGRGRFGATFAEGEGEGRRRGPGCRGRHGHRGGPPPFGPFGPGMFGPPWARGHHGPGPFHGPSHHHHHGPEGRRSSPGRQERAGPGGAGFNLGHFLNNLGERLGVDLAGAAENLGLDKYSSARENTEADFEPRADLFDTTDSYIVHLSLPGAKKEDVGVDWDGENSVLRVAGVVYRPGADEKLLSQLVVDGRKRETGVFEKAIRLGTKNDPASIDVAGISAKMTDGVLFIRIPKVEVEHTKRDVPISGSTEPSPQRNEQSLLFDADEDMYDAPSQPAPAQNEAKKDLEKAMHENTKEKEVEARDDRSETAGREEQLPRYQESANNESDWEKDGSEDEGDYVKINVD
jgi:HSP20 family protein